MAACAAGVRLGRGGACGIGPAPSPDAGTGPNVIGCGTAGQCPAGWSCCALTATCYASDEPWRCMFEGDGGRRDCRNDADYVPSQYCAASDGCTTPGVCANRVSTSDCGGTLDPVCGCDGRSYTNECWARAAGVRIVATGMCRDR